MKAGIQSVPTGASVSVIGSASSEKLLKWAAVDVQISLCSGDESRASVFLTCPTCDASKHPWLGITDVKLSFSHVSMCAIQLQTQL